MCDEDFTKEDVVVFDDVVESVDVGSDAATCLPVGAVFEGVQKVLVLMDVGEFSNVDVVLALDEHGEELEHGGEVGLLRGDLEVEWDSSFAEQWGAERLVDD